MGGFVEVEVMAQDEHANRNKCKFQIAYMGMRFRAKKLNISRKKSGDLAKIRLGSFYQAL